MEPNKGDSSFALQLMSGLMSDVDTAKLVLSHTSSILLRHINDNGIETLDNKLLEHQLTLLSSCLKLLSQHRISQTAENLDERFTASPCPRDGTGISDICTSLLDTLCCSLLDDLVTSSDDNERVIEAVLSLLVSCFSFVTNETRTKVLRVLITLLKCKETPSHHLPVVKTLSHLYDCSHKGSIDQTITDDLLAAIDDMCLTAKESFVGHILVQLVPNIFRNYEHHETAVARLWSIVERSYNISCISRCCFLICGLVDVFFAPGNMSMPISSNLLSSSTLWSCVQRGLQCGDALTRKRAIFILRRALDFARVIESNVESTVTGDTEDLLNFADCLRQLSSVWSEVIVLFESLEEKQVSFYGLSTLFSTLRLLVGLSACINPDLSRPFHKY